MQIDPAILILEGQRKHLYRCIEKLGDHIREGGTLTVQDGLFHLFRKDGEGVSNGASMHDLITGIK